MDSAWPSSPPAHQRVGTPRTPAVPELVNDRALQTFLEQGAEVIADSRKLCATAKSLRGSWAVLVADVLEAQGAPRAGGTSDAEDTADVAALADVAATIRGAPLCMGCVMSKTGVSAAQLDAAIIRLQREMKVALQLAPCDACERMKLLYQIR